MNRFIDVLRNVVANFIERGASVFLSVVQLAVYSRFLGIDAYGLIGMIAGLSAVFGFFNLSLEANLMRKPLRGHVKRCLPSLLTYYRFFYLKMALMALAYATIPLWVGAQSVDGGALFCASLSSFVLIAVDAWLAPMSILLSANLKHHLVAKLASFRALLGLALLLPVYFLPTLTTVVIKDCVLVLCVGFAYKIIVERELGLAAGRIMFTPPKMTLRKPMVIIRRYAGWVHINSSITNVVYRADLYFLAMFHPLADVGKYNVALGLASLVNIITMILGYQNTLAIANAEAAEKGKIARAFLFLSCLVGIALAAFFYFLGEALIFLVSGIYDPDIGQILLCLVVALLLVKSVASPVVSMVLTEGDVRGYAVRVSLPLVAVAVLGYWLAAKFGGMFELALANIVVAIVWLFLVLLEAHKTGLLRKFMR